MCVLTQALMQRLSTDDLSRTGQMIGADERSASTALSTAAPLLVSALARNASKPQGAHSLYQALAQDHDGSILNDLSGFLSTTQAGNGGGILGQALGGRQTAMQQGPSALLGLAARTFGRR